jgi:signal transduction histidine kinase
MELREDRGPRAGQTADDRAPGRYDTRAWARWKVVAASASAVLILIVGTVAFITNRLLADAGGLATASRQTLAGLRQIEAALRESEASVRGYLLTGDTLHLARFGTTADSIDAAVKRVQPLVAGRPAQHARLDTLSALAHEKVTELGRTIAVRRDEGLAAASRLVQTNGSRELSGETARVAAALVSDESARLATQQAVQRRRARAAAILIIVATMLAFVLAATANWVLYRAVGGLSRAAETERRLGADQLAIATENARLYEEMRSARLVSEEARTEAETARLAAERANTAKSQFLSTMSHEIRTPLNAIIGYAELLSLEIAGSTTPEQQAQIGRIRASGQHLLGLLNEVLDLAKVESGTIQIARDDGCGSDVADTAIALVRPQAAAKHVGISESCVGAREATYTGDPQRTRQIIVNLLSNAVKFTPPGGQVSVWCGVRSDPPVDAVLSGRGPWTTFVVEDTGVGIARDDIVTIFHPFTQVETGLTRTKGGTGLGLTISRQLARLMHGDLTVESQPGKGSCFTLWLPASSAPVHLQFPTAAIEGRVVAQATRDEALAATGQILLDSVDEIVRRHIDTLRADRSLERAGKMTDIQLADHEPTFLADIAQSLLILEGTAEPVELMRDGSEIQRVIAERHGGQRYRLGWDERELEQEFRLLRAAVTSVLRERVALPGPELERALTVVTRFLAQAERVSLQAYRHAATVAA